MDQSSEKEGGREGKGDIAAKKRRSRIDSATDMEFAQVSV